MVQLRRRENGGGSGVRPLRGWPIGTVVVLIAAPVGFVLFAMSLTATNVDVAALYTSVGATRLSLRHRRPKRRFVTDLGLSAMWLAGIARAAFILVLASRFELIGA